MKYYKSVCFKALHKLHMYIEYYLFLNREKMTKADIILLYCTSTGCFFTISPYPSPFTPFPCLPSRFSLLSMYKYIFLYMNIIEIYSTLIEYWKRSRQVGTIHIYNTYIYMTNCILNTCILECVCLSKYVFCNV